MYDNIIRKKICDDIEDKLITAATNNIYLASEGYILDDKSNRQLGLFILLYQAFENINIFNVKQQHNLELLYNKISML